MNFRIVPSNNRLCLKTRWITFVDNNEAGAGGIADFMAAAVADCPKPIDAPVGNRVADIVEHQHSALFRDSVKTPALARVTFFSR